VTDGHDTLSGLYELLDRALAAINHGDRATASKLTANVNLHRQGDRAAFESETAR
jgi:hypothetical protein